MKPTSIIFLILSVILIAGGAITCVSAQKMAENNGIDLFFQETDEDENGLETSGFNSDNVNKLTLELGDVDVNIYGGASRNSIELVNFPKNSYEFAISNKNITIDDSAGLMSLFKITSGGFQFNGLRHYLYYDRFSDRDRTVNVYIAVDSNVKSFDIQLKSGNINLYHIDTQADYRIRLGEGILLMDQIDSISQLDVQVETGSVTINGRELAGNSTIQVGTGDVKLSLSDNSFRSYALSAPDGVVSFYGANKGTAWEMTPLQVVSALTVTSAHGSVQLRDSAMKPPAQTALPETDNPET